LAAAERAQGGQTAIKRQNTLDELNNMLSKNLNIRPKTEARLREMVNVYNDYLIYRPEDALARTMKFLSQGKLFL
jgi:hypothetical protein